MNKVTVRIEKDYLTWTAKSEQNDWYNDDGISMSSPAQCVEQTLRTAYSLSDHVQITTTWEYASDVLSCIVAILKDDPDYDVSFHVVRQ